MSSLRFTHRRLSARMAMLILGGVMVLLSSGCYRNHLHDKTGQHFYNIFEKQTRAIYGAGQRHRGMGGEMSAIALQNMYGDAKKSAPGSSGGGGPQLIQLAR